MGKSAKGQLACTAAAKQLNGLLTCQFNRLINDKVVCLSDGASLMSTARYEEGDVYTTQYTTRQAISTTTSTMRRLDQSKTVVHFAELQGNNAHEHIMR